MKIEPTRKRDLFVYLCIAILLTTATYYVSIHDVFGKQNGVQEKQFVCDVEIIITTPNWSVTYSSENTSNVTVAELLFECLTHWNLTVDKTYWSGYDSFFITRIGNYSNGDDDRFWQYYVNDEYADVGCSKYSLHDHDTVVWIFERSKWN